jgi:hypothetical protein
MGSDTPPGEGRLGSAPRIGGVPGADSQEDGFTTEITENAERRMRGKELGNYARPIPLFIPPSDLFLSAFSVISVVISRSQ